MVLTIIANGQEKLNLNWGSLNENKGYPNFELYKTDNGFVSLRNTGNGEFLLEEFDKKAQKVNENELELDGERSFRKRTTYIGSSKFKDKWIIVFTHYDKDNDEQNLYIQEFSKEGMKNRFKVTSFNAESFRSQHNILYEIVNEDQIVFLAHEPTRKLKAPVEGKILVIDANYKLVKSQTFNTSFNGNTFIYYKSPTFDSKGNMYCIAKVFQEKGSDKKETIEVLKVGINSGKVNKLNTEVKECGIYDLQLIINKEKNQLITFALISKESKAKRSIENNFSGFSYKIFNLESGDLEKETNSFLNEDEKAKIIGSSNAKKDLELSNVITRNIHFKKDGSFTLLAEIYYYISYSNTMANGQTVTTTTYYFQSIISVDFNQNGKHELFSTIPKNQKSSGNLSIFSFLSFEQNDNIYVMFNDDIDNCENGKNRNELNRIDAFTGERNCTIVLGTYDEKRRLKANCTGKQIVEDEQIFLRTDFSYKLDDGNYVVYGSTRRNKVFSFGILKIRS